MDNSIHVRSSDTQASAVIDVQWPWACSYAEMPKSVFPSFQFIAFSDQQYGSVHKNRESTRRMIATTLRKTHWGKDDSFWSLSICIYCSGMFIFRVVM